MFVDVWEGLNVRLAISEGETATWSGQMSIMLDKRRAWLLQGQLRGGRGVEPGDASYFSRQVHEAGGADRRAG
jgi:hypothetical protein